MIKKRGQTYWLDIWVQNKRIRRSLRTGEWSLAVARAQEITRELRETAKHTGLTLRDIAAQYLTWAREQKPASVAAEALRLPHILNYLEGLGVLRLEGLTPYHVEQMRGWLRERGRSKATVNRYAQLLRGLIYRAIDWGVFAGPNPVRKVRFYREDHAGAQNAYQPAEVKRILAAIEHIAATAGSPTQRAMPDLVALALHTGLRRSELLGLKWNAVKGEGLHVRGKGDKIRVVPLNAEAEMILGRIARKGDLVFHGLPHNAGLFRRTFARISKLASIPFSLHRLRHTFATNLLAAGVDIVTISDLLGHSRIMTSLLYSHTSAERKRKAVDRLVEPSV